MTVHQVIDLISLKPFDIETISNSVKKTKHVIVVEECMKTGGIGASLSALINESLFDYLDHQVHPQSHLMKKDTNFYTLRPAISLTFSHTSLPC